MECLRIPVMVKFHYSRYPSEQWEESILKIKAGGVTVIPTCVFWNAENILRLNIYYVAK